MQYLSRLATRANELVDEAKIIYPLLGPDPVALINADFVLVMLGQVSLVLLLGTLMFSPYVRSRNATLLNLLFLTVFVSVPPAILYYSGHALNPDPPFGLCLVQAIFEHGSEPMFIFASLALIIELLVETHLLDIRIHRPIRIALLVALPYFVFFVFFFWALILGTTNPSMVKHQPNQLYCTVAYVAFCRGIDILNAVVVVSTIALELFMLVRYRQIWSGAKEGSRLAQTGLSTALVIRLLGFTCTQLFYICLLALDFFVGAAVTHIIPIAYEALMPLATFLIFGTTMDVMEAWKFWGRRRMPARDDPLPEEVEDRRSLDKPTGRDLVKMGYSDFVVVA
ncbi:hypothetical protein BC835DRAFT_1417574 [Cytidiella melzeri]|nr:hypothetical protein BC835DRAFT_1417574 [Cytidiella melzeri]